MTANKKNGSSEKLPFFLHMISAAADHAGNFLVAVLCGNGSSAGLHSRNHAVFINLGNVGMLRTPLHLVLFQIAVQNQGELIIDTQHNIRLLQLQDNAFLQLLGSLGGSRR